MPHQAVAGRFPEPAELLVTAEDLSVEEKARILYRHSPSLGLEERRIVQANAREWDGASTVVLTLVCFAALIESAGGCGALLGGRLSELAVSEVEIECTRAERCDDMPEGVPLKQGVRVA